MFRRIVMNSKRTAQAGMGVCVGRNLKEGTKLKSSVCVCVVCVCVSVCVCVLMPVCVCACVLILGSVDRGWWSQRGFGGRARVCGGVCVWRGWMVWGAGLCPGAWVPVSAGPGRCGCFECRPSHIGGHYVKQG